jgi:purine-nucleoside phosphorylase
MPLVCMQGRFHPFEGYSPAVCTMPIKLFKLLGVKLLILTNAAGGINKTLRVGDIMCIKDHFSHPLLSLNHPLIGMNDSRFGPRFVPINNIYEKSLRDLLKVVGTEIGLDLKEGVYTNIGGPTYETVCDTKLLAADGADVVGRKFVFCVKGF